MQKPMYPFQLHIIRSLLLGVRQESQFYLTKTKGAGHYPLKAVLSMRTMNVALRGKNAKTAA